MAVTGLGSANALARSPDGDSRWLPKAIFPRIPASRPEARLRLLPSLRFADRADLRTGILDGVDLSPGGEYAVMKRRHEILEIARRRLSTMITRFGTALLFGGDRRLALEDYVTVARGAGQNDLGRMAQTVGGAPLTGHGPQLSFDAGNHDDPGSASWRLSRSSMLGKPRDPGLGAMETHGVTDARLSLGLRVGL